MLLKLTKLFLLSVLTIPPFIVSRSLFFPFISGKTYLFHLFVSLAFFFWIILIVKKPQYRPKLKNLLVITILLFLAGLIIVGFFGVDPINSFFSGFERAGGIIQFGFWVLYFLMLISVLRTKEDCQIFLATFLIVAFLISIYSWLNHQIQLGGTFGNPSYLGGFLIFAIGFASVLLQEKIFLKRKFSYLKYFFSALILFFVITLIFTQIRGAYIGLAAGLGLFTIFSILFLRKENKKLTIFLVSVLTVSLIFIGFIIINRESQFVKNYRILRRIAEIGRPLETSSGKERLLTWEIALKAFKDRPIFGWGPENFQAAFNKHYDYRVGLEEPWFDRVHNQSLQYLANGGILLFSFYLFWLFSVFYLIFKIFKKKQLLAAILASTFLAYIFQGLFLFDVFPIYLGLFIFLAFVYFEYQSIYNSEILSFDEQSRNKQKFPRNNFLTNFILFIAFCLVMFLLLTTVWLPYKANSLALKSYIYLVNGKYEKSQLFLEESLSINSPYSLFSTRKRTGWNFLNTLEKIDQKTSEESLKSLANLYGIIILEIKKGSKNHPFDSQIYYVLGKTYRLGFEKLGKNDLDKGEVILKKALNYSQYRIEYFNELIRILVLEKKNEEAENLVQDYVENIEKTNPDDPFPYFTLGNFYFIQEKYDLAMPEYQKAKKMGYKFWENPVAYNRYLQTAESLEDYQKIVEMCQEHLDNLGPDADTLFNLAISYKELNNSQKAKEFFEKTVELNNEFKKYESFFENP